MSIILDISHVDMEFSTPTGSFTALKGIDLQISKGEFVSLIGHSGWASPRFSISSPGFITQRAAVSFSMAAKSATRVRSARSFSRTTHCCHG